MSIESIKAKLASASGVLKRVSEKVEEKADYVNSREPEVMRHIDVAFQPHIDMLQEVDRGLDEIEDAVKVMEGNKGPPLSSDDSSKR